MPGTPQDAYLESRILTADPLELVTSARWPGHLVIAVVVRA